MITMSFKGPTRGALLKAAFAEIEKTISTKAKAAASRHGGVTVRFKRKADGSLANVEFAGSEAAVNAAKSAIQR